MEVEDDRRTTRSGRGAINGSEEGGEEKEGWNFGRLRVVWLSKEGRAGGEVGAFEVGERREREGRVEEELEDESSLLEEKWMEMVF